MQPDFIWQGKLNSGDTSVTINLGSANFTAGNNTLKAWTFNPNNEADANHTNDTLTATHNVYPIPEANTGPDTTICEGGSTAIGANAVAGNTYSWTSQPAGFTYSLANPIVSPLFTTTYYLIETNTTAGCSKTDSVIITVIPAQKVNIIGDSFICKQHISVYHTSKLPDVNYSWSITGGSIISGQGTDSILVAWNTKSKSEKIKLTTTALNGCTSNSEKQITFYQSPLLDIGPDAYICEEDGNLIKIDAGKEFTTYRWYPTGDTTHFLIVHKAGDYYVVVQDKCGNPLQDEIKIVARCPVLIFIPSAFTPDGNGLNETFQPVGNHISEEGYSFSIYNRWGERIFTSTSNNTGWDGKFESNSVPEGIYLWMLECTVKEGALIRKLNKSGTVQLLK